MSHSTPSAVPHLDLTTGKGMLTYLGTRTPFPCRAVTRVSGGFANVTYRGTLRDLDSNSDSNTDNNSSGKEDEKDDADKGEDEEDRLRKTVIIKHSPPYIALAREIALDPIRNWFEATTLGYLQPALLASSTYLASWSSSSPSSSPTRIPKVATPKLLYHDATNHLLITNCAGTPSTDLKTILLLQPQASSPSPDAATINFPVEVYTKIGSQLGAFLKSLHALGFSQGEESKERKREGNEGGIKEGSELRQHLSTNKFATEISFWATYGRLVETINMFPDLLEEYRELFTEVHDVMRGLLLANTQEQGDGGKKKGWYVVHGDFWPGNILVDLHDHDDTISSFDSRSNQPTTEPKAEPEMEQDQELEITVVDWELSRLAFSPYQDLSQVLAELYLLHHHLRPLTAENPLAVMNALIEAYGTIDQETARYVVMHFGVHLVVWTPRVDTWGGKESDGVKRVVEVGAGFVRAGWQRDWDVVRTGVLGGLVGKGW